jgi:hypothetical protein
MVFFLVEQMVWLLVLPMAALMDNVMVVLLVAEQVDALVVQTAFEMVGWKET